jgi:hypothetical protein
MTGEITAAEQAWTAYNVLPFSLEEPALIPQFEQTYSAWRPLIDQAASAVAKGTPEGDAVATDLVDKKTDACSFTTPSDQDLTVWV